MRKQFKSILLYSCIIISTCLVACNGSTKSGGSETTSEVSSEIGSSVEPSSSESELESSSDTGVDTEPTETEVLSEPESSESESESESTKPSESESKQPVDNPADEPSESESQDNSKKFSGFGSEEIVVSSTVKYGTKVDDCVTVYYEYYTDGSKVEIDRSFVYQNFDYSGYHATDEELLPETLQVVESEWSRYEEELQYLNSLRAEQTVTVENRDIITDELISVENITPAPLTLSEELSKLATMYAIELSYSGLPYNLNNSSAFSDRVDGRELYESDYFDTSDFMCGYGDYEYHGIPEILITHFAESLNLETNIVCTKVGFGMYREIGVLILGY